MDKFEELTTKVAEQIKKDLTVTKSEIKDMVIAAIDEQAKQKKLPVDERTFNTAAGSDTNGRVATPEVGEFKKAWKSGQFIQSLWATEQSKAGTLNRFKQPVGQYNIKALGEASGTAGGFMLYDQFVPDLKMLIIEDQIVRKYAQIIPMAMETALIPRINDTSHASSIHGGINATNTAEAGDISTGEGDPAFGQIRLIAHKYTNMVKVSNELLMDSPISVTPLVERMMKQGIGFFEDADFFNGSGSNKPLGVLKAAAAVAVTRTTTNHIVYNDAVNMLARLFPSSYKNAVWVISPKCIPEVATFSISVGTGGSAVFITNVPGQTAAQPMPMTLLGLPILISEKVPNLGTAGDIGLFDFSYYLVGDRMELGMTTSDQRYFETDQTAFRVVERVDGQPWIASALTPYNGGDTLTPFVTLAA